MNLGKNIKKFRIYKNMTQEELADLLNTTSKSVSRWESNITSPDITLLPLLANIFEITVDELLDVHQIKLDEYIKKLNQKSFEYQKNNDYKNDLKLWQEAYKKFPNNETIKVNLLSIMNTINIITNKDVYSSEIIKLGESLLDRSINNQIRLLTTREMVEVYSYIGNTEMATYYAKQMPKDCSLTYDVIKTRFLKGEELLHSIQSNISIFIDEILRESEFITYNNRIETPNEYKKGFLERLVNVIKSLCVNDDDYGYYAVSLIFNYIELAKLEIMTTNDKEKVLNYFKEISKSLNYIKNFKPHYIKSVFMNTIECKHIGGYSSALKDLKNSIKSKLNYECYERYKDCKELQETLLITESLSFEQ